MSADEVKAKARQTAKSAAELLDAVERTVHARLSKEVPNVVNSLDSTFDKASKGLTDALNNIDKRTSKEQAELLKAYRSFLQKQTEIIEKKMASMKEKEKSKSG
jgi:DnaJ-domain-containing protein 1